MLGRPLGRSLVYAHNRKVLDTWKRNGSTGKQTRLMAYFGGVTAQQELVQEEPYGRFQHPNGKRVEIVRLLRGLGRSEIDARLIDSLYPELNGPTIAGDAAYSRHVASANYSVNISGHFCSIPFRFVDGFMLGTGILTDSLNVQWYAPFDHEVEVMDMGPMGYELPGDVDWSAARKVINSILEYDPAELSRRAAYILHRYESLWSPRAFAQYFVRECSNLA
jgi:hypothetical protein